MSLSASAENLTSYTDLQSPTDSGNMCLELALEGERLCKAGDCRSGIAFFQAAIQVGTDDLRTLSAIYSQLGNAYFYLGDYNKAMLYHKHDLTLARTMGDLLGEAKSSGNLGNTLKVMGKFDEAMICCKRHLEISRQLNDKLSEGRALYNLGNVYHAKGKHIGRVGQQDPGEFPEEVKECLQQAVKYYEENLALMKELNDTAAQGRACGNLGNTYYLLGDLKQAIRYHKERLKIAREFGDKAAERRANSNLGNSHIFLGEFEAAAEHYKRTLVLAQELEDRAVEAQACYSLGNTYTLLRNYQSAIEYHLRHLIIAQQLMDRVGEGRACWSLGNAHSAMGNHDKALYFATKHLEISKELGDLMGEATAQMNVNDLRKILGLPLNDISSESTPGGPADRRYRVRRQSMEQLNLIKLTPDGKQKPGISESEQTSATTSDSTKRNEYLDDEESFFDLLSRFQSERMDDQRCSLSIADKERIIKTSDSEQKGSSSKAADTLTSLPANGEMQDDLLDLIAGMQSKRMDEQRVALPHLPGLCPPSMSSQNPVVQRLSLADANNTTPDEAFLEMLMRCQGSRLEDQRSSLPGENEPRKGLTVPDEDFFSLILRLQSGRMEDQRASVPIPDSFKNVHCLKRLDDLISDDDNGFLVPSQAQPITTYKTSEISRSEMPGPGAQLGSLYPQSDGVEEGGGMALSEQTQLRNPLICFLCDDYYTNPCLMQCYHTFCSKCLRGRDTEGHISCPICGSITILKDNATLPPVDNLMKQLIEMVNAENPPCSNCDKRDKNSMFFCSTCGQALCNQCRETIHRAKMFSTHDIVHMSKCSKEIQKRCPMHGEFYIMFNNAQKSMLCVTCFRETPNETRMHCVDIDAAYTQCSKKLDRAVISVCEVQNSVRDALLMFKTLLEELRRNMDCEKHTINTFCQGMQESIAKTHSNMIMEVQRQFETKERSFRGQIINLGTLLPIIQLHLLLCQSFTNIANKYQFLDLAYPMIERLSAIGQLVQPQRPLQTSQIRTNFRNEFTQSLEPWIGKMNQPISHSVPNQDNSMFDHIPAISLPTQNIQGTSSKRQQNVLRTKAMEGEGPFSNHCRSFDSQIKELSQQISLIKERLGDLHRDVALLRKAQTPPLITRHQHITGDCSVLEQQIERHRIELERMKNVFSTIWEEQLCKIHVEQDIFQSQMNEILNLMAEVKHLCLVAQKLEPYIKSLTNVHNVQVSQHKPADSKISDNQQIQELNLHNQQLQSLLEHINSLQLDSQKFQSQSILSPTGTKNVAYSKGDSKDKEPRSRPRTPSQSPGTMTTSLDQSGNVILYESQRTQQSTPSDAGGEKRGVISQLFEKVRTKEDRKKSPEDRERSQGHRERCKLDGRSDIIRTKTATENVHEQTFQRQASGITKVKGKKEKYNRDGKVASIYQSISGRVLGARGEHGSETNDIKEASCLPPPPPPARRAPSQDPNADIRERLETHLKEKLQDMLNKSNINKHISTRIEKARSLDAETVEDISYQRISDTLICSPEDRKAARTFVRRESQRPGSTSTSPHRREEFREQPRVRERSRERRERRDRSRDRSKESRDRSREDREKERERTRGREGREKSKDKRERRDKYGRRYPASDTEDSIFYPGHIQRKQNSCDSLTLSTVSVDSRKSSLQTDLGDRKTLVLVIGSSKGAGKQKGVQKQRSWETFPPKRKIFDTESYGGSYRDSIGFDYRPSSAQDGCQFVERGRTSRDRDREPVEGTLRKADSFEGHEEAVRTLVAAVHQTRSQQQQQQQQQQSRKSKTGGNISN